MVRGSGFFLDRLFRRSHLDREMDEEIRSHIELRAADLQESGLSPDEARRRARLEFGGVENYKEQCREIRSFHLLHDFVADLRYGLRMLRKSPGFTAVAVITLALGIGANTAMFAVVNSVLLRSLPYPKVDRIMALHTRWGNSDHMRSSTPDFLDWKAQNHSFKSLAQLQYGSFNLTGAGEPEQLNAAHVSPDFFRVLQVSPLLGRPFADTESMAGNAKLAVLSYPVWQHHFGGDRSVLGRSVMLDAEPHTIIGVMPRGFAFPNDFRDTQVWTPLVLKRGHMGRGNRFMAVIGRLQDGVSVEQARADMNLISDRLKRSYPTSNGDVRGINVVPLQQDVTGPARRPSLILLGAVGMLLLIACTNLANLVLARGTGRRQEIAVRLALGASTGRVLRQLFIENLLIADIGAAAGVLVARSCIASLPLLTPPNLVGLKDTAVDPLALMFTAGLVFLSTILFGLLPASQTVKTEGMALLKGTTTSAGTRARRFRNALVVVETALALTLLVGAGLLIRTLSRLWAVSIGFNPDHVIAFSIGLPETKYRDEARQTAFYHELRSRSRQIPGVVDTAVSTALPFYAYMTMSIQVRRADGSQQEIGDIGTSSVTPEYFRTLQIPLIRGRGFTEADRMDVRAVAVVSDTMARRVWPGENPLGKRLTVGRQQTEYEVVGISRDVRWRFQSPPGPALYLAFGAPAPWAQLVLKTSVSPAAVIGAVRSQLKAIDPDQPFAEVMTMHDVLTQDIASQRFAMLLLSIFAGLAFCLAAIGVYGVLSYAVAERTHEIGIRRALGAGTGDLLQLIVAHGLFLVAIGSGLGLAIAFAATRVLRKMLFGVTPLDPATFTAATACLIVIGVVASYIPARRATKVDPMVALRYE